MSDRSAGAGTTGPASRQGYDADAIRTDLSRRNIQAVIPARSKRRIFFKG
jgi:hypothetical protein